MHLLVTGMNHRTSPLELRERLAMDFPVAAAFLDPFRSDGVLQEAMLLSTCNRVEVYAAAHDPDLASRRVIDALAVQAKVPVGELYSSVYVFRGADAITHVFTVAASLDSLVVGEPQVLGQVKQAFGNAQQAGLIGPSLNRLLQRAFYVAKRVRSETQISRLAVSVSSVAVDLARKIFQRLDQHTVMLVGAGEMAELAARHFESAGIKQMYILNRTYDRAVALAQEFQAVAAPFDKLQAYLGEVDIAVFSAASPHYLVRAPEMEAIMRARRQRPIFLIDIAVPRNVDPACSEIDSVFLYDVDDLQQVVDENRALREDEAAAARRIVGEEAERFSAWIQAQQAFPVIARLTARAEALRRAELDRTLADLGAGPELAEKLDLMTAALVRKLLHEPIQAIRKAQTEDDIQLIESVRRAFALETDASEELSSNKRMKA